MQRRPTAKSDSSSRRPDAECGRHADGRNRAGEYESQSAAQGGRRWRAHRNRRRPFLRTNTKTHKTTVGNTDNASVVIRIFLSLPLNGKQRTTKTESNATQTQNRSGRRLLRARHAALSRLHRHAPRVVRLAGAHPVPAGPAGRERRRRSGARRRHAAFRPRLLLGRLPAGRDAGRHIAPRRPTHEEPLPLLARENGAALHRAGPLHRRTRGRHRAHWSHCWPRTAPTAASRRTCWLRSGDGATTCWPTSPNASTATPSIAPTSGCAVRRPSP